MKNGLVAGRLLYCHWKLHFFFRAYVSCGVRLYLPSRTQLHDPQLPSLRIHEMLPAPKAEQSLAGPNGCHSQYFQQGNWPNGQKKLGDWGLFVWDTKLRKSLSLKWFNQHYMMILQTDLYYQRPVWQQHQVAQKDKLVKQNPSNQQTKCFQCSAPRIPYGVLFLGIYPESR